MYIISLEFIIFIIVITEIFFAVGSTGAHGELTTTMAKKSWRTNVWELGA